LAAQPRCVVAMEACAGAHYWAREIGKLGHQVRLTVRVIAPGSGVIVEEVDSVSEEKVKSNGPNVTLSLTPYPDLKKSIGLPRNSPVASSASSRSSCRTTR